MKYYIIAGEASGDLHGSNLIREIKCSDPQAVFRAWGGELMQMEGADIVKHYRDLAFMGFWEVLTNLKTILSNIEFCKKDILDWRPDALIFIDYPGFNLRIASFARQHKLKTVYYISPQIWAWKESRVKRIKRDIDLMLVILPFEKDFYAERGMQVHFVGHPLLDAVTQYQLPEEGWRKRHNLPVDTKIIALLPGSRKQEIESMLPVMLEAKKNLTDFTWVWAMAPSQKAEYYQELLSGHSDLHIVVGDTYGLLSHAHAALVTSGTATLETALFGVPEVVCYKGNPVSYQIARRLVKVKYISLVNLIMDREVVKELIQHEMTAEKISAELRIILQGKGRENMLAGYEALKQKLGNKGASKNASKLIIKYLHDSSK